MTPEEIELEKVLDEYAEKFDRNYPLVITSLMSTEDIIKDVRKYIERESRSRNRVIAEVRCIDGRRKDTV